MKRWFYILLGGLGVSFAAGAFVAMIWMQPPGQGAAIRILVGEWITIIIGIAMGVVGLINGRNASELNIKAYSSKTLRDYGVGGNEIRFQCPSCNKEYQASPLLAGKKFTCRDCRQSFEVTESGLKSRPLPKALEQRLLPSPLSIVST